MVLMTAWHDDAAGGIRGKVACLSALLGLLTSMSNELLGCWEGGGVLGLSSFHNGSISLQLSSR